MIDFDRFLRVPEDRFRDCMGMLMTQQTLAKRFIHPSKITFLRDTEHERGKAYFQKTCLSKEREARFHLG